MEVEDNKFLNEVGGSFKEEFKHFIKVLTDSIISHYGDTLLSIVLFGSQARGTQRPDSDIDLLIVLRNAPKSRLARTEEFLKIEESLENYLSDLRKKGINTFINSVIKTEEEIRAGSLLLLDMTEDALILFDRDSFMENVLKSLGRKLEKYGAKRIWRGDSWYWLLKFDPSKGEMIEL